MHVTSPTASLKPERIQERLTELPGWGLTPEGRAVARVFEFPTAPVALAFVGFAAELSRSRGRDPELTLDGSRVRVTLPADGAVTEADLDLAAALPAMPRTEARR